MTQSETPPGSFSRMPWRKSHGDEWDKTRKPTETYEETLWNATSAALPSWVGTCLTSVLGMTVVLYILNQKHMLPKPLSAVVSKTLFWPTIPITVGRRLGNWITEVDDTVLMGGAPFGFAGIPEKLYNEYDVRGVVNLCKEYEGPVRTYKRLGMRYLRLPTVDHFESSVEDLELAVRFIKKHKAEGKKVYVHCRAGHGRSAAAVLAWMLSKDPQADRKELNEYLCKLRDVRRTLWKQTNICKFHARLLQQPELSLPLDKVPKVDDGEL